jgi:hypothetical protein
MPTGYSGVWELNWKLETLIWHQDMILLYPGYCLPGIKTSLALPVTNGVPLTETPFLTHLRPRVTPIVIWLSTRRWSPALQKSFQDSVVIGYAIPWTNSYAILLERTGIYTRRNNKRFLYDFLLFIICGSCVRQFNVHWAYAIIWLSITVFITLFCEECAIKRNGTLLIYGAQ